MPLSPNKKMIENFESEKITSLQTVPEKGPMRVFKLKLND
jgi:hypothetical protein